MIDRRTFVGLAAGMALAPRLGCAAADKEPFLYDSVGATLTAFDVDIAAAALTQRASLDLPSFIQFAWPHPHADILYVACSGRGGAGGRYLSALAIDPASGALTMLGPPVELRTRAAHVTVDRSGHYLLSAHPTPCELVVHRINADGSVGDEVVQQARDLDFGLYAHQARVMPSNKSAILVTRGNDPAGGKPEDPGALKIFNFRDGQLTNKASVAPGQGYGFGARDIDFHPSRPFAYVSLERQKRLCAFRMKDDTIAPTPLFVKETLADPAAAVPGQITGDVHIHPNGRFLYVANRGDLGDPEGRGESNIAVFSINLESGEPTLIQTISTRGFHPRTFTLDAGGRMLVAANVRPYRKHEGDTVHTEPVSLACFHIGKDGLLAFARKYDRIEQPGEQQFWCGMVSPSR